MSSDICPVCLKDSEFRSLDYRTNPGIPHESLGPFLTLKIRVCETCGTGQAYPPCKSVELRDFYEQLFGKESKGFWFKKKGVYARTAHQFITFRDYLRIEDSSVIEIGSNDNGWFKLCKLYRAKSYSYFDSVRSEYIDNRGGLFLGFLNTNSSANLPPSSVDLAVASHSLEHLIPEEVRGILRYIVEVLKPETGKLFVEIPLELEYFDQQSLIPPHTVFFTVDGLIQLLESVGFNVLGIHEVRAHKFQTYGAVERLSKRIWHFILLKTLFPEKFFADLIVRLSSRFYPHSRFDYVRILAQKK